jgi:predicted RNA-binding Zn-ribbon protein involved in translation (DUF1610 family)
MRILIRIPEWAAIYMRYDALERIQFFIYSAGGILLVAALIRFVIAVGHAPALALPEPMLGFPLRYAVLLVGGLELVVALVCLFGKQVNFRISWLAWLATDYLIFQIGLLTMHCHPQATCVGGLTDPLHLSRGMTGLVMPLAPIYLLLGSYWAMYRLWRKGRAALLRDFAKMSCPACGIHLEFSLRNLGQKIPCPQCQAGITLRKTEENLKMACFFCQEHIEFPAHALGQKIKCPHCEKDITLKEPA